MIFFWLSQCIRKLIWLIRPPKDRDIARIDRNYPCPVCGMRDGALRCVWQALPGPEAKNLPPSVKVFCQHTCNECGARWFEDPVAKMDPSKVLPSVPRNEQEKAADRVARLQLIPQDQEPAA